MGFSVSLVAEQRFSRFHDVFWWSRRLFQLFPRWNEEAATLESFDQRAKLFVSSTNCVVGGTGSRYATRRSERAQRVLDPQFG